MRQETRYCQLAVHQGLLESGDSGEWQEMCCLCPLLPTVISHMCTFTRWSCYTANLDTDMPGRASMKRNAIFFDIKKEVIARKQKGEGNTAIGRDLGLSQSNVRTIWHKSKWSSQSLGFSLPLYLHPRRIKARKTLFDVIFNHLYLIIVNNMQCTLISGTILVTDRPIVIFPIGYMYHIERRLLLTYWTFYTRPKCIYTSIWKSIIYCVIQASSP